MAATYGYSTGEWEPAREWVTRRLRRTARERTTVTYSDLCREMANAGVLPLEPHSSALAAMLGQVNVLEHEDGQPLISALVIHKSGDSEPGDGFWNFARELGIDPGRGVQERFDFWVAETQRCHAFWSLPEQRRVGHSSSSDWA